MCIEMYVYSHYMYIHPYILNHYQVKYYDSIFKKKKMDIEKLAQGFVWPAGLTVTLVKSTFPFLSFFFF